MSERLLTDAAAAALYDTAATLPVTGILARRAAAHPARVLFRFLDEQGREEDVLSYGVAWARVRALAGVIAAQGDEGERIALFYPAGLDFIVAFLACLLARRVAVPLNLPSRRRVDRCQRILNDCGCARALTTAAQEAGLRDILSADGGPAIDWLATDVLRDAGPDGRFDDAPVAGDTLAFLQYTSGSTSHPKGVMVSQHNITTNLRMMRNAWGLDHSSNTVFWQPHHHDMGLILGQLLPVMLGNETVLMGPNTFVRQPLIWLDAISRYRAVLAGGPNFAYELCVQRYMAGKLADCDLSSWRIALNGADVVRGGTLDRFSSTFAPLGFASGTMLPCYGLAEATLFVSGGPVGQAPRRRAIDARVAETQGRVVDVEGEGARTVIGCGLPSDEIDVAIVDPQSGVRRGHDELGEIWVSGDTNALGYWNLPQASDATFRAQIAGEPGRHFMRTGDVGFVGAADGQIYICGRLKDLLIVDGRNLHPEDVEYTVVESHALIKPQSCAVFEDDRGEQRRLVAVIEADRELKRALPEMEKTLRQQVRRAVSEEHGVAIAEVVFIPPATLRKTTSGKVQRSLMKALFQQGELQPLRPAAVLDAA
jgi:acyl-CoA synthetase (AMP-forming)/AMP-acid ligase II